MATGNCNCPLIKCQIVGNFFNSMAYETISVSLAHTIKALSPLFTVIAYKLWYGIVYHRPVYFSLFVLTVGVGMVCATNLRFDFGGSLFALGSTFIFVMLNYMLTLARTLSANTL